MKEKDLIKALRKEVTSNMPNVLDRVKAVAVTPEVNRKLKIEKTSEHKTLFSSKLVVGVAIAMVLVFAVAVAMPFVINTRHGSSNSVQTVEEETITSE